MIKFNVPAVAGKAYEYVNQAMSAGKFSGNHEFSRRCNAVLKEIFSASCALLTPSCTHALEMAAILSDIREGDEVIMASYGFTSTANAFVLRGAKVVFVDIRPDTMNMDEGLIEPAITDRTRALVPMHYAGVACEMDKITDMARKYNVFVIEDAAQAILSRYKGKFCGTFGQFGCFSFHETKNIQCGEGGALLVNDAAYVERAEIVQEKGTNRARFFRGETDKYTWVDLGSSYLLGEISAAFLLAQLESAENITNVRLNAWNMYREFLGPLAKAGHIELPFIPSECAHNGHIFYIKAKDLKERDDLIAYMKARGMHSVFHYVPLHSSLAGLKHGRFHGEDIWTTKESGRLLRLPLYYRIGQEEIKKVAEAVHQFYGSREIFNK